jgi:hypothetical protein
VKFFEPGTAMSAIIGYIKVASIVSFFAGAMIGLEIRGFMDRGPSQKLLLLEDRALLVWMAVFAILTVVVFLIDLQRWGISKVVLRFVWVLAFLFGAIAFPLMVSA